MRTKITTVTLNAAIDKTYYLPKVIKGTVMRAEHVLSMAGGKGINVARVLRQLGHENVTATGFVSGYNGAYIVSQIQQTGIISEFVQAQGESRLCLNIIDGTDLDSTEVLEPGPEIESHILEAFKQKLRIISEDSALVVFSGSIPRGLSSNIYAQLIEISRSAGADIFLDASGDALLQGLTAQPSFIKPNEHEVLPLLQNSGTTEIHTAALELMSQGIPNVVVTLGGEGAIAGVRGQLYRVRIPRIEIVNTVGCGDAFVAGYAYGYVRNWLPEDCLRYAAAAGCANALSPAAGDLKLSDHKALLEQVQVDEWNGL